MQFSQLPTLLKLAFAALGGKNSIPVASQLPGNINGASYTDGFPPATRTAIVAGGKPPAGLDVNGVLFDISSHIRWLNAGGPYAFDSGFSADPNVGGYPQGAQIASADLQGAWLSLNDNNTDNPDTGAGTKWVPSRAYGVTAITGLTNATVTLTPAQAAKNRITLAGTLTANVPIVLPTWLREWTIINNTTGAFTITAKTAAGTGVAIPQNGSPTKVVGDGTNITQLAENIAPATQIQQAAQMGQVAGVVGSTRNLAMNVAAASATATLTADEIIVETALGGVRYCLANFNKTINLATTGAGGMDTGTAPASGYVAIYAIYNPTTGTAALLAQNASTLKPNVYGGANMPSGYTASALVSVWATTASGQLAIATQRDRRISIAQATALGTSTQQPSLTALSIASIVPANAIAISGLQQIGSSTNSVSTATLYPSSAGGVGNETVIANIPGAGAITVAFRDVFLPAQQSINYSATATVGTISYALFINGYTF